MYLSIMLLAAEDRPSILNSDLGQKVGLALFSALLSFGAALYFAHRKSREEPIKRISYTTDVQPGLVSIDEAIADEVTVRYKSSTVDKLSLVSVDIYNSGNTVVKDEEIRFEFPTGAEIIETRFDPPLKPEVPVEAVDASVSNPKYRLRHLERGQRVGFRFVVASSGVLARPELHPFNEAGDVDFAPGRADDVARDDARSHVSRFVFLLGLVWLIPPLAYVLPLEEFNNSVAAFIRIALVAMMLPHFPYFVESVTSRLIGTSRTERNASSGIQIDYIRDSSVVISQHPDERSDGSTSSAADQLEVAEGEAASGF